jgi:two-component system NtrC family sensor kinase
LGKSALVVDDEPLVGQIICRVLEQIGYQVEYALDGDEALGLSRGREHDIIVCDILMPQINGMVLYDIWRAELPSVLGRLIFVTGDSLGTETSDFIARSGCPCIFKPFKLNELARVIMEVQTAAEGPATRVN